MRALLITLGSHGDIHPFFALARALQTRGHDATVLTNPHFAKQAKAAGVTLVPLSDAIDIKALMQTPGAMHPLHGPRVVLKKMLLPEVPRIFERTQEVIKRLKPDVLVAHPICMGAPWAAQLAGIPVVSVALAPISWMNPADTIVFGPWRSGDPSPRSVAFDLWLGRHAMSLLLDPGLNRLRRSLGLPKARNQLIAEFVRPGLNLGLWSPHFRPPLPGDPAGGVICGFPWFDAHHDHTDDHHRLDAFLDTGDPPIVFSLGTAAVHAPGEFFQAAIRACLNLSRRGLLLVGRDEYRPAGLPASVAAFTYAPFSSLLPRAALTVHHGGIGTTAQALGSGRPTLIAPLSHDQFDNAARARRLGVSHTLPHRALTERTLTAALDRLLADPDACVKARTLGPAIARHDGAPVATAALEGFLSSSPPPSTL